MHASHKPAIGYVLKRFPRLSETFVLNEILELERQGQRIEVFSLLRPPAEGRHALLASVKARITYLPSGSALERTRLHEGLDETATNFLTALADGQVSEDPLFSGKSAAEVVALHLKAMSVAMLARSRGVEHLHAHFASDAATVALMAGRMSNLPFSFTAHARDIYHTYTNVAADNAMRRAKIEAASFTVTVSDYNRRHLCRLAPSEAARIHRLYNGIDLGRFIPQTHGAEPRHIIAVGRLIEKKGFGDLIAACDLLHRSGVQFICRIIGDGPLHERLTQQIERAGLGTRVEICGPQTQEVLIGVMQKASLAVLPCVVTESGDRDGLPTVLLEAMAMGLPCITTTVSGGPEIVVHGETGLLVEPGDVAGLASSIEALLESPASMARMGQAARKRCEVLFSLSDNVATLSRLFTKASAVQEISLREAV